MFRAVSVFKPAWVDSQIDVVEKWVVKEGHEKRE